MTKFALSRTNLIPRLSQTIILTFAALFALACSGSPSGSPSPPASTTAGPLSAGDAFEGTVTAKLFSGNDDSQMKLSVKGDLTRLETSAVSGSDSVMGAMIMDMKSGTQTIMMPQQKAYMTMNFKQIGEQLKGMGDPSKESDPGTIPKVTPTGRQETIAGYSCEHWLVGDDQTTDLCIAKGLGYFGFGNSGQDQGPLKRLKELNLDPRINAQIEASPEMKRFIEGGAFPLKISQIENGQTKPVMEVTSVERKKLDDSLFTVPADYKKMEIPAMPRGNK